MHKKGDIEESTLLQVIFGAVGLLILVFLILPPLLNLIITEKCDKPAWESLKKTLEETESQAFVSKQVFFHNKGCILASYTQAQPVDIFPSSKITMEKPSLCLCKIEKNSCNPEDCYKFANYDSIIDSETNQQFHTYNYRENMFITFIKSGKTLVIKKLGEEKKENTLSYESKGPNSLDQTNLIKLMNITFTDPIILGFIPVVDIKKGQIFTPVEMPKTEKLPLLFSIELAGTEKGANPEDITGSIIKIEPSKVSEAHIIFNIKKDIYQSSQGNLNLYYKKDSTWKTSNLACREDPDYYTCSVLIQEFSNDFAISIQKQ